MNECPQIDLKWPWKGRPRRLSYSALTGSRSTWLYERRWLPYRRHSPIHHHSAQSPQSAWLIRLTANQLTPNWRFVLACPLQHMPRMGDQSKVNSMSGVWCSVIEESPSGHSRSRSLRRAHCICLNPPSYISSGQFTRFTHLDGHLRVIQLSFKLNLPSSSQKAANSLCFERRDAPHADSMSLVTLCSSYFLTACFYCVFFLFFSGCPHSGKLNYYIIS